MKKIVRLDKIYGYAMHKKDVAASIESNTRTLMQHLIKLKIFPNSEYVEHWRNEVFNFLNEVPLLKNSHKFPSKKFILDNTINIHIDRLEYFLKGIIKDVKYENMKMDHGYNMNENIDYGYNLYELKLDILSYFDWLSERLSKDGSVFKNEVFDKLEELGF